MMQQLDFQDCQTKKEAGKSPFTFRRLHGRWAMRIAIALVGLTAFHAKPESLQAQNANEFFRGFGQDAFFSPAEMSERFFGPPSKEEEQRLREIKISVREEQRFGRDSFEAFRAEMKKSGITFSNKGPRVEYIEELVNKLKPQLENSNRYRRIQVFVADTDEIDGRSFPGGYIILTRGIIEFCDSEAQLVGVIGHELSHLDRQHQLLPLRRSKLSQEMFSGGGFSNFNDMMSGMSIMSQTWTRPFRPEDEHQADSDAATWSFKTDYDPREFAKLFIRFAERRPQNGVAAPAFLRTHPLDGDRFDAVMNRYKQLLADDPERELKVGVESHRERLRTF